MKKLLSLLMVCAMLLTLLAGCGSGGGTAEDTSAPAEAPAADADDTAEAPAGDSAAEGTTTLRVLLESEPEALNPTGMLAVVAANVHAPLFTALFTMLVDWDDGEILPGLATNWEWIDNQHLRLTIRDDVYTAGGTKLVASDVLYSFLAGYNGSNSSYFTMFDFDNFEVESDTSIVLALNTPYPSLLEAFANPSYTVFSESDTEALNGGNDITSICTGRYVFQEWAPGQYIRATKNPDYYNPDDAGYYDEIIYTFNTDSSARVMALRSGDVDFISNIDVTQAATLEADGYTTNMRDTEDVIAIYLNCSRAPFDNVQVRQAINLLLNREAVRAVLYNGYGSMVISPFSSATPYYQEYTGTVDVERAKALLAEAGYADGFDMTLNTLPNTSLAAEVVLENLSAAGINVTINSLDFGAYIGSRVSGDYDALLGMIGGSNFANILVGYDGRLNTNEAFGGVQYQDEAAYALIDATSGEMELEPRVAAVNALSDYLVEQGVMTALCSVTRSDPCRSDITGMRFYTAVFVDVSTMHPVG